MSFKLKQCNDISLIEWMQMSIILLLIIEMEIICLSKREMTVYGI